MTCLTRVKCHMSRVTTSPDSFSSCYYEAGIFKLDEYAQHEAVFIVKIVQRETYYTTEEWKETDNALQ